MQWSMQKWKGDVKRSINAFKAVGGEEKYFRSVESATQLICWHPHRSFGRSMTKRFLYSDSF